MRRLYLVAAAISLLANTTSADISAVPADALQWTRTPEGVAFAPLNGDRFTESYMAMVQLPAGLVSPAHIKSADMFGVIVQGVMTHHDVDNRAAAIPLSEGSFYHIPAGRPHVSSCVSDVDCITFLYQDGAFDFVPVVQ